MELCHGLVLVALRLLALRRSKVEDAKHLVAQVLVLRLAAHRLDVEHALRLLHLGVLLVLDCWLESVRHCRYLRLVLILTRVDGSLADHRILLPEGSSSESAPEAALAAEAGLRRQRRLGSLTE